MAAVNYGSRARAAAQNQFMWTVVIATIIVDARAEMLYLIVTDSYGFRQSYQCDTPQELARLAWDFVRAGLRVMVHEG